jgi:N-acetylmuramic acid 6-phosphate etherase
MPTPLDLASLATEQTNPASAGLDTLSTPDMLAVFQREDARLAAAVSAALPRLAQAVDAAVAALQAGGRLVYAGAGTSGRLGVLDASECPPTFNVEPGRVVGLIAGGDFALRNAVEGVEDDPAAGAADLASIGFSSRDFLVGIAASGRTPYVLGAIARARSLGARTGCIVCAPASPIAAEVEIAVEVIPGPEVITGSTRLKSGTVTKMALNMLSSATMVRLGYVYSNLMVNVQPKNEKLVDRAERIIMAIAGVDRPAAAAALAGSGRDVRVAVVMARLQVDAATARRRLAESSGRLREIIG